MASPHGYPPDPWEYLARLLARALDVHAPPHERRVACDELAGLGTETLDALELEGGWREVMTRLRSAAGSGRPAAALPEPPSVAPRAIVAGLTGYGRELRQMVNDDCDEHPVAVRHIPSLAASLRQRLELAADCVPVQDVDEPVQLARRLAWSALLPGTGLHTLAAGSPARLAALAAHVREVLRGAGTLGFPWRLATYVLAVLRARPGVADAMLSALERLETLAERVRWDPDEPAGLRYRHHDMQVVVARAVREAELLDPECLAVLDLTGAVLLMRAAGTRDLARAWTAGRGAGEAVASAFHDVDMAGELQAEQALRAVFRAPDPSWIAALSAADREAMHLAQAVRARPPGPERELLVNPHLWPEVDSQGGKR